MMRLERIFLCLSLVFVMRAAIADSAIMGCSNPPAILIVGLNRIACEISQSVTIERYLGQKSASPYASAFDQREVVVAWGSKAEFVEVVAGVKRGPGPIQRQTSLLHPPFVDQIAKRYSPSKASRYKQWAIVYEQIEYATQGSAQKFFLECATAIRSSTQATKLVAECFSLGERRRFSESLDAVR